MKKRVLVTGGRAWSDRGMIEAALEMTYAEFGPFVLVHGACPSGADKIADEIAIQRGWEVERHPADWARYHRGAGPKRNGEMVRSGIDRVLAFLQPNSRGTQNCIDQAAAERLDIRVFTEKEPTT